MAGYRLNSCFLAENWIGTEIVVAAEPASELAILGLEPRKPGADPSALASFVPERQAETTHYKEACVITAATERCISYIATGFKSVPNNSSWKFYNIVLTQSGVFC